MPIYEYRCQSCEKRLEFQMKMSDPHPKICPNCGSENTLKKLMSQTAFQLKGGGWYNQAYDGKSNQKPKGSEEKTSTGSEKEASKPAEKSAAPKESKKAASTTTESS